MTKHGSKLIQIKIQYQFLYKESHVEIKDYSLVISITLLHLMHRITNLSLIKGGVYTYFVDEACLNPNPLQRFGSATVLMQSKYCATE